MAERLKQTLQWHENLIYCHGQNVMSSNPIGSTLGCVVLLCLVQLTFKSKKESKIKDVKSKGRVKSKDSEKNISRFYKVERDRDCWMTLSRGKSSLKARQLLEKITSSTKWCFDGSNRSYSFSIVVNQFVSIYNQHKCCFCVSLQNGLVENGDTIHSNANSNVVYELEWFIPSKVDSN